MKKKFWSHTLNNYLLTTDEFFEILIQEIQILFFPPG